MTKDGLVSRSEHILMTYSKEELAAGVECDGVWYTFNGIDTLKHTAVVSNPGTLLLCKPYPLSNYVNNHIHVKFGEEHSCLFAIHKTTFEELEGKVRKCIASHNRIYTELWSSSSYSLYYRSDTDRFELTEWRHRLNDAFYYDVYYGETLSNGFAWYYVNEDHAPFHFGLKEAMKKMNGNTFDEGFERLKTEYIFAAERNENKPHLLECYSRTPTIRLNGQKGWFSLVECEAYILSRHANKEYLVEHQREILQDLVSRIEKNKRFEKAGIPINFFKVGNMTLCRDNTLRVIFQLKIETSEDVA